MNTVLLNFIKEPWKNVSWLLQKSINHNKLFLSTKSAIRMISEESCDTEDWNKGCWKFSFTITGIYYILKYIQRENSHFKL